MLKRSILILSTICVLYVTQIANAMMKANDFNPESSDFSKMDTLKTWIAYKYHGNDIMKQVQRQISLAVRENPFSMNFTSFTSTVGDKSYGKMLPTLPDIELPFLRFVNKLSKTKKPVTLEIGAGIMLVSWKVPFAYDENMGTHYANELNPELANMGKDLIKKYTSNTDLSNTIKILEGDCFSVLKDLQGKCDAIYVANVEHFFNPKQHEQFLKLIESLLAPGGKAFLCANSFAFGTDINNPLFKLYSLRKGQKDLYPGFAKYKVNLSQIKNLGVIFNANIADGPVRPEDDTPCIKYDISKRNERFQFIKNEFCEVFDVTNEVTANAFSPTIYKNTVGKFTLLNVEETFFVDNMGKKQDKWGANIESAAVIVSKQQ